MYDSADNLENIAAGSYALLLRAVFDLHRTSLYEHLGFTRPHDPAEEKKAGEALTRFLFNHESG